MEEQSYVVMVKGILTQVKESELTKEHLTDLFNKCIQDVNRYPRTVRGMLAQAIMKQNGIIVVNPGEAMPNFSKKERNKIKKVRVKSNEIKPQTRPQDPEKRAL